MRRFGPILLALALVACTKTQQTAQPTPTDMEIRQANRLPKQMARDIPSSPAKAYGCNWRISLEPERVTAPHELLASCDAMPGGEPIVIAVESRIPAEGADPAIETILQITAADFSRKLAVAFVERIGPRLRFRGETEARVPKNGIVELRLSLIGCADGAGNAAPCPFASASLSVLASGMQ